MEIELEGTVFCVAGLLLNYASHGDAEDAIRAAGGKVSKTIGKKTQVLVLGSNTWTQEEKARSRGIPVIRERDLVKLLAGERVTVRGSAPPEGTAPMEELIGEARSALDGRPDARMWERVIALADQCAPEQLEELIDYLEPQVARWSFDDDATWSVSQRTHGCRHAPGRWYQFMPPGELRIAPHQWVVDMAAGVDSAKFRLVHAIHTRDMGINGTMLAKILACPSLTHLRHFDTDENKVSKTLFKKIRTAPSTRGLEHLRMARMDPKTITGIDGEHHLEALRELTVHVEYAMKEALHHLLLADAMSGVETFNISVYIDQALSGLEQEGALPNLRTLGVYGSSTRELTRVMHHPVIERIECVRMDTNWETIRRLFQMITDSAEALRHLDLSRLGTWFNHAPADAQHVEELTAVLERWTPTERLERLTLGRWYSDELAGELSERTGIEVVR